MTSHSTSYSLPHLSCFSILSDWLSKPKVQLSSTISSYSPTHTVMWHFPPLPWRRLPWWQWFRLIACTVSVWPTVKTVSWPQPSHSSTYTHLKKSWYFLPSFILVVCFIPLWSKWLNLYLCPFAGCPFSCIFHSYLSLSLFHYWLWWGVYSEGNSSLSFSVCFSVKYVMVKSESV